MSPRHILKIMKPLLRKPSCRQMLAIFRPSRNQYPASNPMTLSTWAIPSGA
ncbi:hypothetical protein FHW16_005236 [Phyllobacterium myrsinacearum]|uniref:Uncharacterized protein n=1 Tax=Phyllobacterium myrsinacearum TaxID=28101 RepID=A0A839ETQ9_9HYPH|nr:hypothetical protein [Phyllobacterium myrsinacearum]